MIRSRRLEAQREPAVPLNGSCPAVTACRHAADAIVKLVAGEIEAGRAREDERGQLEQLTELSRAKDDFFSGVSHEFRTPLTLLLSPLEDLWCAPLEPDQRASVELAHRNAMRLLKLVNALLDFSRLESGHAEAVFEATDIAALTAELAGVFRSAIEAAGLRLTIASSKRLEPVYVDREMWEKIVLNLLSNALKHTFEGEIAIRIGEEEGQVQVAVADTGTGIAAEELPRLFERFHRVRDPQSRSTEGTGIGLALVDELVRLHGGAISVESAVGQGSVFTVTLPVGSAHLPAGLVRAGAAPERTDVVATAFAEEAGRWLLEDGPPVDAVPREREDAVVLVVDDDGDLRSYLRRVLSPHWHVVTAPDGTAALDVIRSDPPDLVLADVMMPRLDGFDLLQKIRADPASSRLPVVLLSARAGEGARVSGLDRGADDYLVKPFSTAELIARVRTNLQLAQDREEMMQELEREREAAERAQARAERMSARRTFVARAGEALEETIDLKERLERLVNLLVPEVADHAVVELVEDDGSRTVAAVAGCMEGRRDDVAVPLRARGKTIGMLAAGCEGFERTFTDDDRLLLGELARLAGHAIETARLHESQRTVATVLQRSLLAGRLPREPELEVSVRYRPAVEELDVGGDWYDVIRLEDGRIGLVVGDVVGRGLEAATTMGQLRNAARALAFATDGPAALLEQLEVFAASVAGAEFATLVVLLVDPEQGTVRYASAGHPPALLVAPDGTTTWLDGGRSRALGIPDPGPRAEAFQEVEPGSLILAYTDGLIERRGQSLDTGFERLARAVATSDTRQLEDLADAVLEELVGRERGQDDVALLFVRLEPVGTRLFYRCLPALPEKVPAVRAAIRAWLEELPLTAEEAYDILLASGEAISNSIEHAYEPDAPGDIEVEIRYLPDGRLSCIVRDDGRWRRSVPSDERGRGRGLIERLVDEASIVTGEDGTRVSMLRRVAQESPA